MTSPTAPAPHDDLIDALRDVWLTDTDLEFLREVDPVALARIVAEVQAHARRVHEGQRKLYEVLAASTRLVPNFMVVKLAGNLSPYVLAQVSEHLEPKAAAGLTKSFDAHLLGEIVLHIDVGTAARIATHMDLETLVQITESLATKGLHKRLGEVSDALDERMLEKLVLRIKDPARIAAVTSHMHRLDHLARVGRRLDAKLVASVVAVLERGGHGAAANALRS